MSVATRRCDWDGTAVLAQVPVISNLAQIAHQVHPPPPPGPSTRILLAVGPVGPLPFQALGPNQRLLITPLPISFD